VPFEPEPDERKVAAYVGLSPDQRFDIARFPIPGDRLPGGEGYALVHWAVGVEWDVTMDGPPPWPWAKGTTIDGERRTFQLWLIQCYRPGHPLAAERRWHPDLGARDAIVGLTEPHSQTDVLAAWQGHALITGYLARRGPPLGRGKLAQVSPDRFTAIYAELAAEHADRGHPPPDQQDMATKLGEVLGDEDVSRSTVSRYCTGNRLPWPPC
jgi:hypothetical protein